MLLNTDEFENARQIRDPRFDGRFFVGVLTTGIYCRPICPVRVPKKENVQLYKSAAAAAEAGFRPCLRCCPESSPGTPAWSGSSWKVSQALQLIDQGFLDNHSVGELAEQLALGPRHLSRLFQDHLGASAVAVAQTRRLHFAKKLIDETCLNLSEICFAAGFGSVRRFNSLLSKAYSRSPRQLREKRSVNRNQLKEGGAIELSLSYRPPFDCEAMLDFLAYRAIPGVEAVTRYSYARTFCLEGLAGHFQAFFEPRSHNINVCVSYGETRHLNRIIERIRALFDIRADSAQIDEFLVQDSQLAPMVTRFPGLRVPGCWSGFEVAVRAILGQQVTVKAASTLIARVAKRYGEVYECDVEGLSYTFPEPARLVEADLDGMGIVGARIEAIRAVAEQLERGELDIGGGMDTESFVPAICRIKGVGEWTAQYIAMRALGDPNAFPHSDLILRRAVAEPGDTLTPSALRQRAESWQPWRAYCAILLWKNYAFKQVNKPIKQ